MENPTELIRKYNRPGPRYTSYPPVPFWNQSPSECEWIEHITINYKEEQGVDLYVHVPFCESLCYYCGCNRTITKNHDVENGYIEYVLKEWKLYQDKLGLILKINSLHFGGGTPTFLSPENLDRLLSVLLVNKSTSFIGSIEIDPRTCEVGHLKVLRDHGIKRVSLGIQDFDQNVQRAIHREQSVSIVEALVDKIRSNEISSINFDLIYGLPKQTTTTITETIKSVVKMRPDLIAYYGYAHLPDKIKNQRLIKEEDLPEDSAKRELFEVGKKLLIENGYVDIGMDHFALKDSYLYRAKITNSLHRNFMGYVDKKSDVLIGLGPTSISDSSMSFVQNMKDLKSWEEKINRGELPIEKGHTHTLEDVLAQKIILKLMCRNETTIDIIMPYWDDVQKDLKELAGDGLIELTLNEVKITSKGEAFVRNVAMVFDHHLRAKNPGSTFSWTI